MVIKVDPKSYSGADVNLSINFDQHWLTFQVNQPIKIYKEFISINIG